MSYAFWSELRDVRIKAAASAGKLSVTSEWDIHSKTRASLPAGELDSIDVIVQNLDLWR